MIKLKLSYNAKDYPYNEEHLNISWGRIRFDIYSSEGFLKNILDIEWDIQVLLDWFFENKNNILNEKCPLSDDSSYDTSIAELIFNFYNKEKHFTESLLDMVFDYRSAHGIRFAMRGTDIPDFYIGNNQDQIELSYYDDEISWKYNVDVGQLYNDLENVKAII